MKNICYYYHDINEEPESFKRGMKVRKILTDNNIEHRVEHNEDVWEESYIMVKECDYDKAKALLA
jgi:HD superfamily phosphodiesterase